MAQISSSARVRRVTHKNREVAETFCVQLICKAFGITTKAFPFQTFLTAGIFLLYIVVVFLGDTPRIKSYEKVFVEIQALKMQLIFSGQEITETLDHLRKGFFNPRGLTLRQLAIELSPELAFYAINLKLRPNYVTFLLHKDLLPDPRPAPPKGTLGVRR